MVEIGVFVVIKDVDMVGLVGGAARGRVVGGLVDF